MFAQGRRQNYIGVPSHAIGYFETKSVYPSGLVVLQLTFCFVEHHIIALSCHYWQHVIKSGKSNFRVVMKYMK